MEDAQHPEIIIVRRRGGHEEEHHGGAWKIAFADFMTAMMAFFLVLWIINATDKDTKTIIARYFNPVKLEEIVADAQEHSWRRLGHARGRRARRKPDAEAEAAWPGRRRRDAGQHAAADADNRLRQAGRQSAGRGGQPRRSGESQGEHERERAVRRSLPQSRLHRRTDLAQRARDHAARRGERRAGERRPRRSVPLGRAPGRPGNRGERAVEAAGGRGRAIAASAERGRAAACADQRRVGAACRRRQRGQAGARRRRVRSLQRPPPLACRKSWSCRSRRRARRGWARPSTSRRPTKAC